MTRSFYRVIRLLIDGEPIPNVVWIQDSFWISKKPNTAPLAELEYGLADGSRHKVTAWDWRTTSDRMIYSVGKSEYVLEIEPCTKEDVP